MGRSPAVPNLSQQRPLTSDEEIVYLAISAYPHCLDVGGPCSECAAKVAIATLRDAGRLVQTPPT